MKLIPIRTQSDFEEFLDVVDRLHDSILREAGLVSRGFVERDRRMFGDTEPTDARFLFQSQSPDFAGVEIFFEGVEAFLFRPELPLEPDGNVHDAGVTLYLGASHYGDRPRISASRMTYRLLDASCLGSAHRFVSGARAGSGDST